MDIIKKIKIDQLIEKRNHITDIAAELYGDLFVLEDKFWGSPIEKEMEEVTNELYDLGYRYTPTQEEKVAANLIRQRNTFNLN